MSTTTPQTVTRAETAAPGPTRPVLAVDLVTDPALVGRFAALARRLEDRVMTVERIIAADNPDWKPGITSQTHSPYRIDRDEMKRDLDQSFNRRN